MQKKRKRKTLLRGKKLLLVAKASVLPGRELTRRSRH